MRIRGLEILVFRKVLRTYLMDGLKRHTTAVGEPRTLAVYKTEIFVAICQKDLLAINNYLRKLNPRP